MEGALCPLSPHCVSFMSAGTSEEWSWINTIVIFGVIAMPVFPSGVVVLLTLNEALPFDFDWLEKFSISHSAVCLLDSLWCLLAFHRPDFHLCRHIVTRSQAGPADCSWPAALCGTSSVHLLTAGCPPAWGVANHPWAYLKTQLRSNGFLLCSGELDTFEDWFFLFLFSLKYL